MSKVNKKLSRYSLGIQAALDRPRDESEYKMPPLKNALPTTATYTHTPNMVQSVVHKLDGFPVQARKTLMAITDDSPDIQQPQKDFILAKKSCLITCDNVVMMANEASEKAKRRVSLPVGDSAETWSLLREKNATELLLLKQDSKAISEKEGHLSGSCAVASIELFVSDMSLSPGCDTALDTADCDTDIISPRGNTCGKETDLEIHSWNKVRLCKTVEAEHCRDVKVEEGTTCEFDLDFKERGEWSNGTLVFSRFTGNHFALGLASGKELDDSFKRPHEFLQSTTNRRKSGQGDAKTLSHVGCGLQHLMELDVTEKADVHNVINGIKLQPSSSSVVPLEPQQQEISLRHREKILEGKQQCGRNRLRQHSGQCSVRETSNKKYSCNCTSFAEDENIRTVEKPLSRRSEKNNKQKVLNKLHERGETDNCQSDKYHMLKSCSNHNIEKLNFKPLCSEDPLQSLDQESKESRHTYSISSFRRKLFKTITLPGLFVSDGGHTDRISLDSEDIPNCVLPSGMECVETVHSHSSPRHFKMDHGPSISETAANKRSKMHQKPSELSAEHKFPTQQKRKNKSNTFKLDPEERSTHVCAKQENLASESPDTSTLNDEQSRDECVEVIETIVITEKIKTKCRGKKKKRRCQSSQRKAEDEPSVDKDDRQESSKEEPDASESKLASPGRSNDGNASALVSRNTSPCLDRIPAEPLVTSEAVKVNETLFSADISLSGSVTETQSTDTGVLNLPSEDSVKQKSLFHEKDEKQVTEQRPREPERPVLNEMKELVSGEMHCKKLHKEVVKQKPHTRNRVPKILQNIQVVIAPDDSESIILRCRFGGVTTDSSAVWTKEGTVLAEEKRSTWDEGQVSYMIAKVSSKDLGWYRCCFSNHHGNTSSEFHLTSDVLNELVPSHNHTVELTKGVGEDVKCTPLLFREDFLREQFFGEDQWASILTEEVHFGEGMHRKAFRTKLLAGLLPLFTPGHPCVLKVHNAISYGTKNNEELLRKNYDLAVEECHVQNTARQYIKAYTAAAKSAEAFGEVPEIIPIYLVHRPSNDIPYATLEEELLGDFVKYSVKDGKEINLMRRDSEAGQKCCAFQHWVYEKTDGNLLVTDMQGVGMKLTDVGIATCKKGYKGFKGNCATTFIDQFKALHQCNRFCEILGLKSLQVRQQKPRRKVTVAISKRQPVAKKNVFPPTLKNTS